MTPPLPSAYHWSPPRVCAQPPPVHTVHHDCTLRHQEIVKYDDNTTIISHIINNNESSFLEEIKNLAQRKIHYSMCTKYF